ncbi:Thiamine-monophosphate kinase, partial [hydrothermal vent metagenome]
MPDSEFDIIERYFQRSQPMRDDVLLGIGDDAALLRVPAGKQLVVAVDTLVAGRHFPKQTSAADIGHKALAVNLSDLAAMGATPAWATLALTLPTADTAWLQAFSSGFFQLADEYAITLIGGDTTRGPLSITVQVHGFVEPGRALQRSTARPGDAVYVSGTLGEAACALQKILADEMPEAALLQRLNRPQPRVALGQSLAGLASAAIDISDGLLADLGRLLTASSCGATLWPDRLPCSSALQHLPAGQARDCQFNGGDDYELCFTLPEDKRKALAAVQAQHAV